MGGFFVRIKGGKDRVLTHQFGTRETTECSFYNWMVLECMTAGELLCLFYMYQKAVLLRI